MDLVNREVLPCIESGRSTVVIFPEDTALPAAFLGSRGAKARAKKTVLEAYIALSYEYAGPVAFYARRFPERTSAEQFNLATTDTVWRAFFETMREVAKVTGVHVVTSGMASPRIEPSSDPTEVAELADPDAPERGQVYVARDADVNNFAWVFSPTGEIVGSTRKSYLVLEEENLLSLVTGPRDDASPVNLDFARLGLFTSKDAWMPDVVDREVILGASLFVQPESFQGWVKEQEPGDWPPDVITQSSWLSVQKHGGLVGAVIAHLTGNLFEEVVDGQSVVLKDAVPGQVSPLYVGQPPMGGVVSVMPWVEPDPGLADGSLSLELRRNALRAVGDSLRIGRRRANQYRTGVTVGDLNLAAPFPVEADGPPGVLGASHAVARSDGDQRYLALAGDGADLVVVAWEESSGGRVRVRVALSSDGGDTFGWPLEVGIEGDQHTPALAVDGSTIWIAWQQRGVSGSRVLAAVLREGETQFGLAFDLSTGPSSDDWLPAVAASQGVALVAYVETSGGNERIRVARTTDGLSFEQTPADALPPRKPGRNMRNNQWAPAVTLDGSRAAVAWVDFRSYNWDVYLSRSTDGGKTFLAASRVDDGTDNFERLNDDVQLARAGGSLLCAWSDIRLRVPVATARIARDDPFGGSAALSTQRGAISWRPHLAALGANDVVSVWQDFRSQGNDIYLARSSDGGKTFGREERVDDGGDGPSYQFRPRVALNRRGLVVAWEDSRSGRRQVRLVVGR